MIVKSPSGAIQIPESTIHDFVLRHAERLADKPAIIDAPTGRTLSYGQFADMVRRVATALDRRGFRKGDVFAVYSHNVPEYAVVFNAVALVGGVVTTANPLCTAAELTKQLKDSRPRLMVTALPYLDKAKEAAAAAGVETLYMFGGEGDGVRPFDELLDAPPNPPSVSITPSEDVVVLPYSSGTTGLPKGVMLTHRNVVANLCQINGAEAFDGFQERDSDSGGAAAVPHLWHGGRPEARARERRNHRDDATFRFRGVPRDDTEVPHHESADRAAAGTGSA